MTDFDHEKFARHVAMRMQEELLRRDAAIARLTRQVEQMREDLGTVNKQASKPRIRYSELKQRGIIDE